MSKKIIVIVLGVIVSGGVFMSCSSKTEVAENTQKQIIDVEKFEEAAEKGESNDADKEKITNDTDESKKDNNIVIEDISENKEEVEAQSEKVKEYFKSNKSYVISKNNIINYRGYSEQGFDLNFLDEDEESSVVTYKGTMSDGYGEDERGERIFRMEYYFHEDAKGEPMAYERVRNEDYMAGDKEKLVSIIKNYIIMWGNIEAGKEWTQSVSIDGIKYTAKTEIVSVTSDTYSLSTIIEDIEGYKDNLYKEERTYQKDKGLVEISCSASGMEEEFMVSYTAN